MFWLEQQLTGGETGSARTMTDRRVIINGDDFGLSSTVNEGIILAYREGVLRSASLMVGEAATEQAVELARRDPGLAVGLHIALSDARPVLPPEQIPDLVRADGRFHPDESYITKRLLTSSAMRCQVRAEIAAQFAAFRNTGLPCDHVNTHRNAHLHPVIALAVFQAAARERVPTVRIPWQPRLGNIVWHRRSSKRLNAIRFLRMNALRRLAQLYGLQAPDHAIDVTGRGACLASFLSTLPCGTTELYFHPATTNEFPGSVPGFPYVADFATLRDPAIQHASANLVICGYREALQRDAVAVPVTPMAVALRGH